MKKTVSILMVLCMIALAFAGCASPAAVAAPAEATESAAQPTDQAAQAAPAEKQVIRLMCGGAGYWESALDPVVAEYNASQDKVQVVVDYYQYDALLSNVEVKFGAKSTDYDMVAVDAPLVAAYTTRGYIIPLDSYFTADEINQFVPSEIKASVWDGKFMAAPMNNSSQLLWYNADLLKAAGLELPSTDPAKRLSWEQVEQMAAAAQKAADPDGSKGIMGIMFEQVDRAYQMLALPNSFGAASIGDDGFTVDGILNSDGWTKALEFYQGLYNSGVSARGVTAEEVAGFYTSGKVVFMVGATWTIYGAEGAGLNYGYAPCPYFEGYQDKAATSTGSWHIGISAFTDKADACADFIKYITLGKGEAWNRAAGNVPSTLAGVAEVVAGDNPVMAIAAYEAEHTAVPRPVTPGYSEYESVINQLFADVRNGADIATAVDTAIQSINTAFAKYKG